MARASERFTREDPQRSAGWFAIAEYRALPIAERRRLMRAGASEDPLGDGFLLALHHDAELKDEAFSLALRRLRAGDLRFFSCLTLRPEDRRIRSIALQALRRAKGSEGVELIRALGRLGGTDVLPELRRRFRRAPRSKWREPSFALAGALLRLDPQALDAARFLASALRSRSWSVRQSAARALQKTLNPHAKTEATMVLGPPVLRLLDQGDLEPVFIMARRSEISG